MSNKIKRLFSHLQNGQNNRIFATEVCKSKAAIAVLNVLQQNGYIRGYRFNVQKPMKIEVLLKYKNQEPAIRRDLFVIPLKKVSAVVPTTSSVGGFNSKNSLYLRKSMIISTSKGIISGINAHKLNVGGELVC